MFKSVESTVVEPLHTVSSKGGPKKVKKLQFTRRGVLIHEVSCPESPASKKCRALDVAQQIKK